MLITFSAQAYRLVCVDDETQQVNGIITLSLILLNIF